MTGTSSVQYIRKQSLFAKLDIYSVLVYTMWRLKKHSSDTRRLYRVQSVKPRRYSARILCMHQCAESSV